MNVNEEKPSQEKRGLQSAPSRETISPSRPVNSTSVTPPPKYQDKVPHKKRPVSLTRPMTPDFLPSYLRPQPPIAKKEPSSPYHLFARSTRSSAYDLNVRGQQEEANEKISSDGHKQSFRVTVDSISTEGGAKQEIESNIENILPETTPTATTEANANPTFSPRTRKAMGLNRTSAITDINPLKFSSDGKNESSSEGNSTKRSENTHNPRDILKYLKQNSDTPLKVDEVGFEISLCIWSESELLEFMKNGSFMLKYSKKGKSPSKIKLKLSSSEDYLIMVSANSPYKKEKKIYLRFVDELRKGQKTKVFATQKGNRNKFTTHLLFNTSFSLIYGSSSAKVCCLITSS